MLCARAGSTPHILSCDWLTYPCCVLAQVASLVFYRVFVFDLRQELDFLDDVLPFLQSNNREMCKVRRRMEEAERRAFVDNMGVGQISKD